MKRTFYIAMLACASAFSSAAVVFSNNTTPGDAFTNVWNINTGQAVTGSGGWYYNNVRNSGVVGINNTYARSGNGSAYLETKFGPSGSSSKADIEFLVNAAPNLFGNYSAQGALCTLGQLASVSYEWYRDSVSTASSWLHPSLRILLDADGNLATTNDRGGLVFERAYNVGTVPVATDTWVSDSITSTTKLWNFGLGVGNEFGGYDKTLSDWINGFTVGTTNSPLSANSLVLGFSSGVGSGWGPFKGAVDNIGYTLTNGQGASYNFEVAGEPVVPGPAAALPMALGLLASLARRKRK